MVVVSYCIYYWFMINISFDTLEWLIVASLEQFASPPSPWGWALFTLRRAAGFFSFLGPCFPEAAEHIAMNPVNTTALYVSASRAVLQCDPRQPHSFAEMYKLLPFFRKSLACLVCGKWFENIIATQHTFSPALMLFATLYSVLSHTLAELY